MKSAKDTVLLTGGRQQRDVRHRSEALKERIYVTFTALAVTVSFAREEEGHLGFADAAPTLALTVVGTLLAIFVADVISFMMREAQLPSAREMSHMLAVSLGSLRVIVAPLLILGASALGRFTFDDALRLIVVVLVITLVVIVLIAVARLEVAVWVRVLVLGVVVGIGALAVIVELAAH